MIQNLSIGGIASLLQHKPCYLQIIDITQPTVGSKVYTIATLSDGFSYQNKVVVTDSCLKKLDSRPEDLKMAIVKIVKSLYVDNKQKQKHLVIEDAQCIRKDVREKIGNPISHDEFLAQGGNPKGANIIPPSAEESRRESSTGKQQSRPTDNKKQLKVAPPLKPEPVVGKPPQKKPLKQATLTDKSPDRSNSKPMEQKKPPAARSVSNPPIQKVDPPKKQPHQAPPSDYKYSPISSLFSGQEGWTILIRVVSRSDIRKIKTRKGEETDVLNMEFIDREGSSIHAAAFGESAEKYYSTIQMNSVYEISNCVVVQDLKTKGGIPFKLTINEKSSINEANDDGSIPSIEDRCCTLAEYVEKPVGSECNIICLVKGSGEIINFTSKAGKPCTKRQVTICDPQQKIEVKITVWGDAAHMEYENCPYYFSNMTVKEYMGQRQFSSGFVCNVIPMKDHRLRKFKDVSKIQFSKSVDGTGGAKRGERMTIADMLDKANKLEEKGKCWSEIRCLIGAMRTSGTMWYLSCPECKKKVVEETRSQCPYCQKFYENGKYRFILSVELADSTGSVWASAYDEMGETILHGRTADELHTLEPEALKEIAKQCRNMDVCVLFLSKQEQYEGQSKIKHSISKIFPIDYVKETELCVKQIEQYLSI